MRPSPGLRAGGPLVPLNPLQAALLLLISLSAPARADLSFVQVVQAQASHGAEEGLFGKTWVELKGLRMRIVSGYAGKIGKGGREEEPRRVIQLLDLDRKARYIVYPEKKAYARAPLGDLDYDNRMAKGLFRGRPVMNMELQSATLTKLRHTRRLLGVLCEHYHLHARFSLQAPDLKRREAFMDQDVWVAPLTGALSAPVLELIAFENAYRDATGGVLSPLDHERYQLREAAAYLQVPQESLHRAVERLREKFRELPSYPVASSVSWRLPEEPGDSKEKKAPPPPFKQSVLPAYAKSGLGSLKPARNAPPHLPPFQVINWRSSERGINRMYVHTRVQVGGLFPLGPLTPRIVKRTAFQEPSIYHNFHKSMEEALHILAGLPAVPQKPPPGGGTPFYEIYAELHGLQSEASVPASDLALPDGYQETKYPLGPS